jgi:hypothetical protein
MSDKSKARKAEGDSQLRHEKYIMCICPHASTDVQVRGAVTRASKAVTHTHTHTTVLTE